MQDTKDTLYIFVGEGMQDSSTPLESYCNLNRLQEMYNLEIITKKAKSTLICSFGEFSSLYKDLIDQKRNKISPLFINVHDKLPENSLSIFKDKTNIETSEQQKTYQLSANYVITTQQTSNWEGEVDHYYRCQEHVKGHPQEQRLDPVRVISPEGFYNCYSYSSISSHIKGLPTLFTGYQAEKHIAPKLFLKKSRDDAIQTIPHLQIRGIVDIIEGFEHEPITQFSKTMEIADIVRRKILKIDLSNLALVNGSYSNNQFLKHGSEFQKFLLKTLENEKLIKLPIEEIEKRIKELKKFENVLYNEISTATQEADWRWGLNPKRDPLDLEFMIPQILKHLESNKKS